MAKKYLVFILFFSFIAWMSAQDIEKSENKESFFDQVYFGGGIQLSIGNYYSVLGISPSAIYEFDDNFATGLSATYLYVNEKQIDSQYHVVGGSILAMYNPIRELQLNSEFEYLRMSHKNNLNYSGYWVPALYIGAGYAIGKHGAVGVRYDLLWKEDKSIYNDALTPYFRFYF